MRRTCLFTWVRCLKPSGNENADAFKMIIIIDHIIPHPIPSSNHIIPYRIVIMPCIRYQVKHWRAQHNLGLVTPDQSTNAPAYENGLEDGDVLVSNHPQLAGGSHLPDITVITPIFSAGKIVFFVASRGHHADIGGIAPGSMPPLSKVCYN
jgi:hypothetical protein